MEPKLFITVFTESRIVFRSTVMLLQPSRYLAYILIVSFGYVISIVARLRAWKPWNCGSNSGRCKKFICSANHSAGLGDPLGLLLKRRQRLQCGQVIKLSTHLYVVSRLRMTGATTPIPRMRFWYAQGKTLTFTWVPYTCRFPKWYLWGFSSTTEILYTLFCHERCVFCPSHRTRHVVDLSYG